MQVMAGLFALADQLWPRCAVECGLKEAACAYVCPAQLFLSRVSLKGAGKGPAGFLCGQVARMLVKEEKGIAGISLE